jgi:transposase
MRSMPGCSPVSPPSSPTSQPGLRQPQTQALAALVSRLDQLSDLRQSESCRAHQADDASVKASIGAVIEVLDSQIGAIEHAIDALIARDPILDRKGHPPALFSKASA